MQFTATEPFLNALKLLAPVFGARSPKPILQCVRIEALAAIGKVILVGSDLERYLSVTVETTVTAPGSICVPFAKLNEIIGGHKGTALEFSVADGKVRLTGGGSAMTLHTFPASDFPMFPVGSQGIERTKLPAIDLYTALRQVEDATAAEQSQYAINGVLLESIKGEKHSHLVATDGRRLHVSGKLPHMGKLEAIIPANTVKTLGRLLAGGDEVSVAKYDGRIVFSGDNWMLDSAIVEGSFPPWRDVIPKETGTTVTVDSVALASAVRRASVTANEESRSTTFDIGDTITLSATTPEVGSSEITVPAKIEGKPVKIGFNGGYVIQALLTCPGDATLGLTTEKKPMTVRGANRNVCVVMPVNIQ